MRLGGDMVKYDGEINDNILISVIMPVYNVDHYLDRAIKSILNQTVKRIELILIDDGSKDKSGKICDYYAALHPNIKVIHQENSGTSVAKNNGLRIANGKYIGFVDSDDYIDVDMYEFLYKIALKTKSDIVACSWRDCYKDKIVEYGKTRYEDTISIENAIVREVKDELYIACNKLFSCSCLENITFREGCTNGEDRLFVLEAILNANQVSYRFCDKYNYCHRLNSAGTKKFKEKDFHLMKVCKEIIDIIEKYNPNNVNIAERHMILSEMQLLGMMNYNIKYYHPYGGLVYDALKNKYKKAISGKGGLSFIEKLKYILLIMSPCMYRILKPYINKARKNKGELFD